jgi:uncharacterized protein YjcR
MLQFQIEMQKLYEQGWGYERIGKRLGCNKGTVRTYRIRNKWRRRPDAIISKGGRPKGIFSRQKNINGSSLRESVSGVHASVGLNEHRQSTKPQSKRKVNDSLPIVSLQDEIDIANFNIQESRRDKSPTLYRSR